MAQKTIREVMAEAPAFIGMIPEEHRTTNDPLTTLQVNVGYRCNLACRHCHLECGPLRTEAMNRETMQACLDAYETGGFKSIDITGGAPEMHPDLEWFLLEWKARGVAPIVRTNLCILTQPEYAHFVQLYADVNATLFASLPFYSARNVDKIRGDGTFMACIEALRMLNAVGYGDHDGGYTGHAPVSSCENSKDAGEEAIRDTHSITLVFNPAGATMPPDQTSMELQFHRNLARDFDVHFTNLVTITNNPIGRFAEALNRKDKLGGYLERLVDAFNPATTEGMMCRDQISVDWAGNVYDCDFNQALGLRITDKKTIYDFARERQGSRPIVFANHCYACTAGAGSS